MPKKSNTRRSDGRIAVQVYLGRANGKRQYKTVYGKTQKEADQKAAALKAQLNKGIVLAGTDRTFQFWANQFLASKKNKVSQNWHDTLTHRMKCFTRILGNADVSKIRLCDVQMIIDDIANCNPTTNKPSSKKTMVEYSSLIKRCFDYIIANRVIEYNPCTLLSLPADGEKKKRKAISKEQQLWISETPHRAQTAAMIMLYTGLRRGELSALQWRDIDFENKSISVTKSYNFKEKYIKCPKTDAGNRTVPIPDILVEYLQNVKKTSLLVFPNTKGNYMTESAWQRLWANYMKELNKKYGCPLPEKAGGKNRKKKAIDLKELITIDTFTPHNLRHTYCTLLYDAGVGVVTAKELMGHSDIKTTLSIYTHLSHEKEEKDIEKLNQYLLIG